MPYLDELGAKAKAKYPEKYGDLTDLQAGRVVKQAYPNAEQYKKYSGAAPPGWVTGIVKPALNVLPAAGGIVGGALGAAGTSPTVAGIPAGAVGGAALGGAAGEGLRRAGYEALGLNQDQPETTPAQEAFGVAAEGTKQAFWEIGGRWIALGGKLAGRSIMAGALRRAGESAPQIAKTAVQEGIAASRQGVIKLNRLIRESSANVTALLDKYRAQGVRFDAADLVTGEVRDLINQNMIGNVPSQASKRLVGLSRRLLAETPQEMTPLELLRVRQKYDAIANAIHKARGTSENPLLQDLEKRWAKTVADRARAMLHDLRDPVTHATDVAEQLGRSEELIQLKNVLAPGVKKGIPLAARFGGGAAVGAAAAAYGHGTPEQRLERGLAVGTLGTLAASPIVMSMLAHLFTNPATQTALRQLPRTAAYGLKQE